MQSISQTCSIFIRNYHKNNQNFGTLVLDETSKLMFATTALIETVVYSLFLLLSGPTYFLSCQILSDPSTTKEFLKLANKKNIEILTSSFGTMLFNFTSSIVFLPIKCAL